MKLKHKLLIGTSMALLTIGSYYKGRIDEKEKTFNKLNIAEMTIREMMGSLNQNKAKDPSTLKTTYQIADSYARMFSTARFVINKNCEKEIKKYVLNDFNSNIK